jgi:hypothetical protein
MMAKKAPLEKRTKISPAMIAAGDDVFWTVVGEHFPINWPLSREFVRKVFVAMRNAEELK